MSTLTTALALPSIDDEIAAICATDSLLRSTTHIKKLLKNEHARSPEHLREIFESALAREVRSNPQRRAIIQALKSAIGKLPNPPATVVSKAEFKSIVQAAMGTKPAAAEVTTEQPKDPRWDRAREVSDQLRTVGRLFLRGQVKLGMILAGLKKEFGITPGQPKKNSPDSGKFLPWAERVKQETGYSRQSCDEFIRLYEATKAKLKTSKKLDLPAPVKKDAIVLFQAENPLSLSEEQWTLVDQVIGTLTTGETQASLMQELGIIPKPKPMPGRDGSPSRPKNDDITAGQLAFHFFDAVAAPLINARTNPDYKKLLYALPLESDEDHPLSISTLEAEARALLADIAEVREKTAKPAKGRTVNI